MRFPDRVEGLFANTHALVDVMPRSGMTIRLPQMPGGGNAWCMSMTGKVVGADRAVRRR